jgi:hypothetical protein
MGGNQRGGAMPFVPHVAAAIKEGALPPVIVVLVNGMVNGFYCDYYQELGTKQFEFHRKSLTALTPAK